MIEDSAPNKMSTQTTKRKMLSIEIKKEILCDVDRKLLSKKKIAEKYGIPHNSLSTIIKNREKIESSSQDTSRKILRLAKKGNIDEAG